MQDELSKLGYWWSCWSLHREMRRKGIAGLRRDENTGSCSSFFPPLQARFHRGKPAVEWSTTGWLCPIPFLGNGFNECRVASQALIWSEIAQQCGERLSVMANTKSFANVVDLLFVQETLVFPQVCPSPAGQRKRAESVSLYSHLFTLFTPRLASPKISQPGGHPSRG